MEIALYTPNLEMVYENSVLFIHYCYQGILSLAALINIQFIEHLHFYFCNNSFIYRFKFWQFRQCLHLPFTKK